MHSLTEAGPSKPQNDKTNLIDSINQVFTLFQVNYHNQYYKAFPDRETENLTKKLWLESLRDTSPAVILGAAEKLVRSQDYLPTLSQMLKMSRLVAGESLPDVHGAFIEACQAPSPKAQHSWSHPLVYHAGQRTGWRLLATQPETFSFPVFRKQFEKLEQEYLAGQSLNLPQNASEPKSEDHAALDAEEGKAQLAALRSSLKI